MAASFMRAAHQNDIVNSANMRTLDRQYHHIPLKYHHYILLFQALIAYARYRNATLEITIMFESRRSPDGAAVDIGVAAGEARDQLHRRYDKSIVSMMACDGMRASRQRRMLLEPDATHGCRGRLIPASLLREEGL